MGPCCAPQDARPFDQYSSVPAPDLGQAVRPDAPGALTVHPIGERADASAFAGSVVVMIDQLRASSTIAAALANGAHRIHPVRTVDEARASARSLDAERVLLAGERGGVMPEGFDLGNSPQSFTPDRVGGRTIVCTTTNGTATLLHAATAERVLVASLANRDAVCEAFRGDPRPVHLLCAGTRGGVTLDDLIAAGALVERSLEHGRALSEDDGSRVALRAWQEAQRVGVERALRDTRGGRNLAAVGLDGDIPWCARVDHLDAVPAFDAALGSITRCPASPRPAPQRADAR